MSYLRGSSRGPSSGLEFEKSDQSDPRPPTSVIVIFVDLVTFRFLPWLEPQETNTERRRKEKMGDTDTDDESENTQGGRC